MATNFDCFYFQVKAHLNDPTFQYMGIQVIYKMRYFWITNNFFKIQAIFVNENQIT